jgi:hypothetical protein
MAMERPGTDALRISVGNLSRNSVDGIQFDTETFVDLAAPLDELLAKAPSAPAAKDNICRLGAFSIRPLLGFELCYNKLTHR